MNHEYTDDGLLHPDGMDPWTARRWPSPRPPTGCRSSKSRGAGAPGSWSGAPPSPGGLPRGRPCESLGPPPDTRSSHGLRPDGPDRARHDQQLRIRRDALGAYLACEENFNGYFVNTVGDVPGIADPAERKAALTAQKRYGVGDKGSGYRWHEHDERFDAARHPNEPNRFGYVVEIDPTTPKQPVSARRWAASSTRTPP